MLKYSALLLAMATPTAGSAGTWLLNLSGYLPTNVYEVSFSCADMSCLNTRSYVDNIAFSTQLTVPSNFSTTSLYLSRGGLEFRPYVWHPLSYMAATISYDRGFTVTTASDMVTREPPCYPWTAPCVSYSVGSARLVLNATFVSSDDGTAPVPEPATWVMMIAGFGLVGATLRTRRRSLASTQ